MRIAVDNVQRGIAGLARQAGRLLEPGSRAHDLARHRASTPVDYMRCAEFFAVLHGLEVRPGQRILDVGSPQWFSLHLAARHPETWFHYVNVLEAELRPFADIADVCGLGNIVFGREDVRALASPADFYDQAISISVLEHVAPEVGGDVAALAEIRRALRPGGKLHLTVPYKSSARAIYVEGPVYERDGAKQTFFSREYDRATFAAMIERSGFREEARLYITERLGLLALDFFEWGPGRRLPFSHRVRSVKRRFEQLSGRSFDAALARHYLRVDRRAAHRLVNVAAVLTCPIPSEPSSN